MILSLVMVMSLCFANAAPVDSATARTVAENFYGKMANIEIRGSFFRCVSMPQFQNFYIFNAVSSGGFVIVSADDRAIPILGYSETGGIDADNLSLNFVEWLSMYDNELEWTKQNVSELDENASPFWRQLMDNSYEPARDDRAVSPLLNTKWGQDSPYNYYCPYNSLLDVTCPSGCVATAMAQVMKYWEWPTCGNGSHSYDCSYYGTQSANFYNAYYFWYDMPNTNPSSSNRSIAKLMYHCGVSVDMDYGYNGSGSYINLCVNALKNYFRYSSSVCYVEKGNYSDSQWRSLLKTELDNDRPIIYAGQGSEGAHAFVCDGYNSSNYFHFNWGWEGSADGYFSLSALSPGSYNLSSGQRAVIGIEPGSGYGGYNLVLYSDIALSIVDENNLSVNQTFSLSVDVANFGSRNFDGQLAVVAVDVDDESHYYVLNPTAYQLSGGTYRTTNFSLSIPEAGTYYLMVYYLGNNDDYYHYVFDYDTYVNGVTVVVSGLGADSYEANNTASTAYPLGTVNSSSKTYTVNATVHTSSDVDYYKVVCPAGYNYTVNATLYSAYNSNNYTAYAIYNCSTNTNSWGTSYDGQMPARTLNNGGTVYFRVSPVSGSLGTYQLKITVTRSLNTGIEDTDSDDEILTIYPNPASGVCNVHCEYGTDAILQLYDVSGRLMLEKKLTQDGIELDISSYASGIYFVRLYADDRLLAVRKLLKK